MKRALPTPVPIVSMHLPFYVLHEGDLKQSYRAIVVHDHGHIVFPDLWNEFDQTCRQVEPVVSQLPDRF